MKKICTNTTAFQSAVEEAVRNNESTSTSKISHLEDRSVVVQRIFNHPATNDRWLEYVRCSLKDSRIEANVVSEYRRGWFGDQQFVAVITPV